MRYVFASIMTFLLLIGSSGCATQSGHRGSGKHRGGPGYRKMPATFYMNGEAVVTVRVVGKGIGTGAVVDTEGLVITNQHVIASEGDEKNPPRYEICQIVNDVESCSPATVIAEDAKLDLALLETKRTFPHAIRFASGDELKPFDFVYNWAIVANILPPSPFRGRYVNRITPKRLPLVNRVLLIFDLSTNPGGSGSPIFDRRGFCVAVTLGHTNFSGMPLTVAVPGSVVVKFIEKNRPKRKKTPTKRRAR